MAEVITTPLSAQPNAGLPRAVGDRRIYLASPEYMAQYARRLIQAGARFIGGCCGTTPEHIRRITRIVADARPAGGGRRHRGPALGADRRQDRCRWRQRSRVGPEARRRRPSSAAWR